MDATVAIRIYQPDGFDFIQAFARHNEPVDLENYLADYFGEHMSKTIHLAIPITMKAQLFDWLIHKI